ncbi:MAG: hypothetical protein J6Z49_02235 [Kiritimatiellae bacterium]|nr:hypothetical protein [Kiritimatiellia bacterium]
MTSVSHGKPCAGNPHARFEEGASAPESPRRNALLHKTGKRFAVAVSVGFAAILSAVADTEGTGGFGLQHAEFAKYYRQITGKDAPDGTVRFAIDSKVSKSGKDAYRIVSTERWQQKDGNAQAARCTSRTGCHPVQVTISGSNVRSVWYGLYDLLERRGGCRWFWDGDVVSKRDSIDLSNLDIREEAHFEYRGLRYFAHRGLTRFQAEHWGPEDWRKEIDWLLKRRLNVFMLRIGQDDLFQRTFPDACPYPDPSKPQPGMGKGYDDRTIFWSLQYRGELRRKLQKYAFDRGLMVPEDFGTMSHWYSPTPDSFLVNMKPSYLPQSGGYHNTPHLRVWDVRDEKWSDAYWKMTKTAVESYGQDAPAPRLLHTIGLGERRCYKDPKANFALKADTLNKFVSFANRDYPDAKILLAGWDFLAWTPKEINDYFSTVDTSKVILWDYAGDRELGKRNFTNWGVVGKFPYTYSVFLAYEKALDARANYPLIEERQKIAQNDPACKGFIFWPESSHTDTLFLRFFTVNAWSEKPIPHGEVLGEFCTSRYGGNAALMKEAWTAALPASWLRGWGNTCVENILSPGIDKPNAKMLAKWDAKTVADAQKAFEILQRIPWRDPFVQRDAIDIARMVLDRTITLKSLELAREIDAWRAGGAGNPLTTANVLSALCDSFADLLALHADYSIWESYRRLDAIEKIQNPDFEKTLFDNASCSYCRSHQYELARHWYAPHMRAVAARLAKVVADGDRKASVKIDANKERAALMARPLESLKPTLPRTEENFRNVLREVVRTLGVSA